MPIKDWSCPGHVALPEVTSKSGWVITTKTSICDSRDPVASLINSLIRQVINQLSSYKSATNPMKSLFFAWLTHYVPMVFLCFFKTIFPWFSFVFQWFSTIFPGFSFGLRAGHEVPRLSLETARKLREELSTRREAIGVAKGWLPSGKHLHPGKLTFTLW